MTAEKGPVDGRSAKSGLPLAGVRVVSIEQFAAGPWATLQLADLGAEVVKLEDPDSGGDLARYVPPYQEGGSSLYFETFNRGKRSVALELRNEAGRGVFEDLVRAADVVFANVRGDVVKKLRISYEDLAPINPRVVCCSLSGYGRTGPRAAEGAYDHTIQAIAGWQQITGEPEGPPIRSAVSVVDFSGGYAAAIGILAAVLDARRSGLGTDVDIALQEVAVAQLSYLATWSASRGYEPRRQVRSSHPTIVPFQTFAAADGWLVIACPKDELWRRLCAALDRNDLAEDPRYMEIGGRSRNRETLVAELERTLSAGDVSHWLERLRAAGVPSAPVNDVAAALSDPQVQSREAMVGYDHPMLGPVKQPASPIRLGRGGAPAVRAPLLGEHTRTVLEFVCGYDDAHLDRLREVGAFGASDDRRAEAFTAGRGT
jgi:crotonobetainyl-CoA:carnitine CoA-transferase CaiB-like acyl-CoA transferase